MMKRIWLALAVTLLSADAAFAFAIPGLSENQSILVLVETLEQLDPT